MRKLFKQVSIVAAAAVMACSSAFFAGCGYEFKPLAGEVTGEVSSQGGFAVQKGEYVYFINGIEAQSSDNTYGTPVKGALMRIKMADVKAGNNTAEVVVPSLMVAADYTSGLYIYGDRIYFATPNTVGNTLGEVDTGVLSFRSAKLDGSDVREHHRVGDSATVYRYVEAGETVYLIYEEDSTLYSYNTASGVNTSLAEGVGAYVVSSSDKSDPYLYYTMQVSEGADTDSPYAYTTYNQIYRVRADATQAPYEYTWSETYLEDHDGEAPYHNLGEIVLDGIGRADPVTQFNHDVDTENNNRLSYGYTYTLQSYANGGIYFVRSSQPSAGSSVGSSGELYYLPASSVDAEGWNSVSGNSVHKTDAEGALEVVASAADTSNASSAAYFYLEEDATANVKHHYLYVSDSVLYRVDVVNDGNGTKARIGEGGAAALGIAFGVGEATIIAADASGDVYDYVYYTCSEDDGLTVGRAVYNGTAADYRTLVTAGGDNAPYHAEPVLGVKHASGWYNYEVLDGVVFYADATAYGETTYNYIWTANLTKADGAMMTNAELAARNDYYEEIVGEDGYVSSLTDEGNGKLSGMVEYFFRTGKRDAVDANIEEAIENGKSETYLYSEEEKKAFDEFVEGKGAAEQFKDGDGKLYTKLSYFTQRIGALAEADEEAIDEYWRSTLQRYSVEDAEEGLPTWAWVLIGVGIALVVAAGVLVPVLILKKRRKAQEQPREARMAVDTMDDREVDVYAVNDPEAEPIEEIAEDVPAEDAEAPAEASGDAVPEAVSEEAPAADAEPAEAAKTPSEAAEAAPEPAPEPAPEAVPEATSEEPSEEK